MMTRIFRIFSLPALLLVAGCSLSSPTANFYTLSAAVPPANGSASSPAVAVTLTEFSGLLDRPQIMLRTSENRLEIQELDRWAEPLDSQFLHALTENLVRLTGSQAIVPAPWDNDFTPDHRVAVAILRFDGTLGKVALLRARWTLHDAGVKPPKLRTSTLEEPTGATIESLVAAQSRLVARLAEEIAEALSVP